MATWPRFGATKPGEIVILRKVVTIRLIAVGVVGTGLLAVGFLFNALCN